MPKVNTGKMDRFGALALAEKPDEMQAWLDWVALPEDEREPRSKQALADSLGINITTIHRWQSDPRLLRPQAASHAAWVQSFAIPKALKALATQAADPENPRSVQASKVLLQIVTEERVAQVEAETSESFDAGALTTDQLRDLASALESAADEVDGVVTL